MRKVMFNLGGKVEHDRNGKRTPLLDNAKMGNRTLDGPVQFETKYN